ncbi:MAG TPA: Ig-like domain-containing protein, partial [Longimicrobiaceae bacterium]|nr:Ig-like domain-containing protein [Longimicrobiaceae bacterium]
EGAVVPAAALDRRGEPVPGARLSWSSSDPSVASVDSAGHVLALRPGRADVSVRIQGSSGQAASIGVRVAPRPDRLEIGRDTLVVAAPGNDFWCEVRVTATQYDRSGSPMFGQAVSYSVEDTTVAVVRRRSGGTTGITTGFLTGRSPGETRLIASANGYQDTAVVKVLPGGPARVLISPRAGESLASVLTRGDTVQLEARVVNECGGTVSGPAPAFTSGKPEVLEVSPGGRVVAREVGYGYVYAGWSALRDSVSFSVYDYRLLPADTTVAVGDTVTYRAFISFSPGVFQSWAGPAWASSDSTVARPLDSRFGPEMRILAAREGEATVTAERGETVRGRLRVVRRP